MKTRRHTGRALTFAAAILGSACASSGTGGSERNANLLTQADLAESNATNLHEAISRLRPRWLVVRSPRSFNMDTEVVVLQNETYMGSIDVLRQMPLGLAVEIEYLEGSRAATTLPGLMSGRHIAGAIIVRTRKEG